MILIATILTALPLGYLVRSRTAANLAYAVLFAQVFTFQTAFLVMGWVNGSASTFSQSERLVLGDTIAYLIVSSAIYAMGFALVEAGHRLRERRRPHATIGLAPA